MKVSQNGINLIKKFEGFKSKPYLCAAGVATIGYGSTYYENGARVKLTDSPITEDWADQLLRNVLKQYELSVDVMTRDDISQNQFDALVSFAYNVGIQNFKTSTLLKRVNANPNDPDIKIQFARWIRAEGRILKGLVKRREIEANLYFSG